MAVTAPVPVPPPAWVTRPSLETPVRPPARAGRRRARPVPRPSGPTSAPDKLPSLLTVDDAVTSVEHILPLSGCRLSVLDFPDGSRVGQLFGPSGRFLDEARCERTAAVSGWFGRARTDRTSWALAFGAGGSQEALDVRFASVRARRVVSVMSDHYGLWIAEVVGAFRAATLMSQVTARTFRLHYAG